MSSLVIHGQTFSVPMLQLITHCSIFQTTPALLAKPYDVQSRVSIDSFGVFVGVIGGTNPAITPDNVTDLGLLADEFKFAALSTAVADWRAAHPLQDADTRLVAAALDERLQAHDRALSLLDRVHRRQLGALAGEIGVLREAIVANDAKFREELVSVERQLQEPEAQGMADVRNEIGRLGAQFQAVVEENGRQMLAVAEMRRVNEKLEEEVAGLKQRVDVLEQDNQRLLEASEVMKRDVWAHGTPKTKRGLTNLERELVKLKREKEAMEPNPEPPAADVLVPPALGRKSSSSSPSITPAQQKHAPVKVAPPPATPKQTKQFPLSAKRQREFFIVPDGIIAHLTRECGGNVHDSQVVDVTSGSFEKETLGTNPHSGAWSDHPILLRRMQLIWELRRFSGQLTASSQKIFRTRGTIGCATISRRERLCQHTT
jgi:predicted nucleic acid-binding protein